jgi:PTH1 family peptidyl-tRNA hydrolase
VVGLGNPGSEFAGTRHNAGAEALAVLVDRHGGRLRSEKGLHAQATAARIGGHSALLAIPQTFMNESGSAVVRLVRRAGVDRSDGTPSEGSLSEGIERPGGLAERLIVVHDELDLPSGRVKVKSGGGNAGNNGLKSIESHLHTKEYLRVRIGIGKPPGRQAGADYVLKRPGATERARLAAAIEAAADAVEALITDGVETAMNRVNTAD